MIYNKTQSKIDNRLLFRRQFFLGPKFIYHLENWNKTKVNSDNFITSHPDLELTEIDTNKTKLILLGFILDPENPLYDNSKILDDLLSKNQSFRALSENTSKYSGRWILIQTQGDDIKLFTDACGARSVFYHFSNNATWCASQPHTIADLLHLEHRDNSEFLEFINSKEFDKNERTLFGQDTLFKDVYHLLPNHYLSVNKQYVKRYWPYEKVNPLTVEQAIKIVTPLLKGLYTSANNRFKLIQPVTAGRDTRLLLAASKNVRHNIYYFIQKFKGLSKLNKDIRLPGKLLSDLNLKFHVEKCYDYNKEFDKYLRKNVYMIQSDHKKVLHYNFFKNFQDSVNVSGNYTGIYRPFPWQVFVKDRTPLIKRTIGIYFRKYKYVVDFIDAWEKKYNEELANYNYPITDIFYWENKAANWVSMFINELDIAIEEWCPLNNRKILSILLAVDPALRINENLQTKMVKFLWSETLHAPLASPGMDHPFRNRLKKLIYDVLNFIGLWNIVKKHYNRNNLK